MAGRFTDSANRTLEEERCNEMTAKPRGDLTYMHVLRRDWHNSL